MARSISDEELQLRKRARRRLVGAIVLVTAVAVVLPMVLDTEPRPVNQDISIEIPSPDSGAFKPKVVSSTPSISATSKAPASESKTVVPGIATKSEPSATSTKQPEASATRKSATEAHGTRARTPLPAKPGKEHFVIQVIALADADKAMRMQRKISDAGVKSYTEVVKTAKGDVTRVRAGPFATREAAEKIREKLKGIGFDGKVIPVK